MKSMGTVSANTKNNSTSSTSPQTNHLWPSCGGKKKSVQSEEIISQNQMNLWIKQTLACCSKGWSLSPAVLRVDHLSGQNEEPDIYSSGSKASEQNWKSIDEEDYNYVQISTVQHFFKRWAQEKCLKKRSVRNHRNDFFDDYLLLKYVFTCSYMFVHSYSQPRLIAYCEPLSIQTHMV